MACNYVVVTRVGRSTSKSAEQFKGNQLLGNMADVTYTDTGMGARMHSSEQAFAIRKARFLGKSDHVRDLLDKSVTKDGWAAKQKTGWKEMRLEPEEVQRWDEVAMYAMKCAVYHKMKGSEACRRRLEATGDWLIVEVQDFDSARRGGAGGVWTAGMTVDAFLEQAGVEQEHCRFWTGANGLGEALMAVRSHLRAPVGEFEVFQYYDYSMDGGRTWTGPVQRGQMRAYWKEWESEGLAGDVMVRLGYDVGVAVQPTNPWQNAVGRAAT